MFLVAMNPVFVQNKSKSDIQFLNYLPAKQQNIINELSFDGIINKIVFKATVVIKMS